MKRHKINVIILAAILSAASGFMAYADTWQEDERGWRCQDEDGRYFAGEWQWIDGNGDGVSECYYFDENGYLLTSTTTPDQYTVNADGAWEIDGVVQTQGTAQPDGPSSDASISLWNHDSYWYDKDDSLSEGDKAAYHYYEHYYRFSGDNQAYYDKVGEQYSKIEANPCHEVAIQEMQWVEIPVWRLRNGQKVPDTDRVQVLSSVAEEVKEIFTEIYNGPEQFPINSISVYVWRGNGLRSMHSAGLAIDINPDQNPQVGEDGTVYAGSKWEPGVNPYSISRDSDVVKAFGNHAWDWGASFQTKDYMHFEW